jgi:hypothetical protein
MPSLLRIASGLATTLVVSLASVGPAAAATVAPQLLDVSQKVAQLQQEFDDLNARGGAVRTGRLTAREVCGEQAPSKVFWPWGDAADYVLAPNGGFASTAGWDLDEDARVVVAPSPSGVGNVLSLADGAEAVSPVMCIRADHPTIRLFARNTGRARSRLEVTVLYEDTSGHVRELTVARLNGGTAWSPTAIIPIYVNLLAAYSPAGVTPVAVHFRAIDVSEGGRWQLDDLYVDPFKGH